LSEEESGKGGKEMELNLRASSSIFCRIWGSMKVILI